MLKNVVPDDSVNDPDLKMVLVNALAMDMEWEDKFDATDTFGREFTKANGEKINATMMSQTFEKGSDFHYYKDDDIQVMSKDLKEYDGKQFEFIAILPNQNLKEYISKLDSKSLNELLDKMGTVQEGEVHLKIPKFEYDYTMEEFTKNLDTLGIQKMFSKEQADLSFISSEKLYVSNGIHKAKIEFGEDGVRAAAVTAFFMRNESIAPTPSKVVDLIYDKPFFYIRIVKIFGLWVLYMNQIYGKMI